MSSSTGLGRTRSLRQPASISTTSSITDSNPKGSAATRNTSPSRLPQVKPLTRSATTSLATSSPATRVRPSASSTTTTTTMSRRPLSGIFSTAAPNRRPSATSTAVPDSTAAATTITKPAPKRRPLSGVFSGRTTASAARRASPTSTGPENNNNTTAAPKPLGRAPSIRQAPSSTATTTTTTTTTTLAPTAASSKREPAGLSQATTGYGRPKSTATALTSATTLKPPSSQTAASTSTSTPTSAAAKPLTRAQTLGRNGPPAGNASSAAAAAAAAAAPPSSANLISRPAFNTNQQHYSPLKSHAPKPMTSTFLAPPSPSKLPANVAISAETARRQTELLQLSLLHREAAATDKAWHASAEAKLGARFARLVAEDEELRRAERDRIEDRNVAVLLRWGQDGPLGLDEKVQILDQVLSGVWDLSEPGGRYARVADEFEKWAERVADIVTARQSGDTDSLLRLGGQGTESDVLLFVSELDNHWRDECAGLLRKLDEWRRALQRLGGDDANVVARLDPEAPRPSLLRMLEGARALLGDMLAELAVMQQMEREATRAEDEWIEKMNVELNLGDARERTIPLWKLVA